MRFALTRPVSPRLNDCELTYLPRQPIDVALASAQHRAYLAALRALDVTVIELAELPDSPDSVFIEDTALVFAEIALVTPMGSSKRHQEREGMLAALAEHRPVVCLPGDSMLEGGDVMLAGQVVYVGISTRTDRAGIIALRHALTEYGYEVRPVRTRGCLHFKTGCTYLGDDTVVHNPQWIDQAALSGLRRIESDPQEPWAANTLRVGDTVLLACGSERTQQRIERAGFHTQLIDVSELAKAEAGLTCMSLLFDDRAERRHGV